MRKIYLLLIGVIITSMTFGQLTKSNKIASKEAKNSIQAIQTKGVNADLPCTSGNLFSNPYENINSAVISEESMSTTQATQFATIGGSIETVSVWAINAVNSGAGFSVCDDADLTFDIVFYEDNGGDIGDTAAIFEDQTITRTATSEMFASSYTVYEYSFTLPSAVDLVNGFVSLRASNDETCWFMWINTESGYGNAKSFNDTVWTAQGNPFTVCLGGTADACTAPTALNASDITTTSADLSWAPSGDEEAWNIEYGEAGFVQGTGTTVASDSVVYNLTGLTTGTTYEFYVQADCGTGSTSIWAGPYTFSTMNCEMAEKCAYPISMTDSYGDGWNGGEFIVYEEGIEVFVADGSACDNGGAGAITVNDTIYFCPDMNIELEFVSGSYDEEIAFSLGKPFGGVEYSTDDASTITAGIVHTFVSSCDAPQADGEIVTIDPVYSSCELGMSDITVHITNNSINDLTGFSVSYTINDGTPITETYSETIASFDTVAHTFGTQADFTADGTYDLAAYVEVASDEDTSNDTAYWTVDNVAPSAAPYSSDFETADAALGWGLEDVNADGSTWNIVNGYGVDDGVCAVYEYNSANAGDDWLYTTCLDLTGGQEYKLTFDYAAQMASYPEKMDIYYGDAQDASTMTNLIGDVGTIDNETFEGGFRAFTPATTGTYYIGFHAYSDADMYLLKVDNVVIDISTEVASLENVVNIYPNPAKETVTITNVNGADVVVYNIIGEVVASFDNASDKVMVDVSNLAEGTYIVNIKTANETITKKINVIK